MNEVGIYRGSFDPPHNGHRETVELALKNGMTSVTITYTDVNCHKPFRKSNEVRGELLKSLFQDMQNVFIVEKSYKAVVSDLSSNSTISKIHLIIGSDILNSETRSIALPTKLCYFIIHRSNFPLSKPITVWNNLPAQLVAGSDKSSSCLQIQLFKRDFLGAKNGFPLRLFDEIVSKKLYLSTDNEFQHADILLYVKKLVEKEIVAQNLAALDQYPLSFELGQDIGVSGLSGDIVCFVKDSKNKMLLVIKIFLGSEHATHYQSEILGYKTLSQLHLSLVAAPQVFFSEAKENFSFIMMSFVQGKSLAEVMLDCPDAVRLCARANAELHSAQRTSVTEIHPEQIALYEDTFERIRDDLAKIAPSFLPSDTITRLNRHWSQMRESFRANPGSLSYTHGDPNHSNWIVDSSCMRVTYIDLSLFQRSISPQQSPYGFAMNELEEALLTFVIAARRIGTFSDVQVRDIQRTYENEYLAHAPKEICTQEARRYFASYWAIRVMENHIAKIQASTSDAVTQKQQAHLRIKIESFLSNYTHK